MSSERIDELEEQIAELKSRWPAHSVPPTSSHPGCQSLISSRRRASPATLRLAPHRATTEPAPTGRESGCLPNRE